MSLKYANCNASTRWAPALAPWATLLSALVSLSGCGGGGGDAGTLAPAPTETRPAPVPVAVADCTLPALPIKPAQTLNVRDFGAVPDDGVDDTAAIQRALGALGKGQWLVFPAGTYEHRTRLNVLTEGAVLWSEGATLHATNPDDQAVMLGADGASIYNFTLTAITTERLYAPWHARIAIFDASKRSTPLLGNVIQGNRIVAAGAPGTPGANSASAAGIYVDHADGFAVLGNEVRRSMADGMQFVQGSRNGRIMFNTVRETGDDMIGLVSYMAHGDWLNVSAASLAATLDARRSGELVRNLLVAHNDLAGNYWGRGISVIGGADLTIANNRIDGVASAAGILIAREAVVTSWGVDNVLLQDNAVSRIQTRAPDYPPVDWTEALRTGHGAIEFHAFAFDDELGFAALAAALAVQNVRVARTSVAQSWAAGVRVGAGSGERDSLSGVRDDGSALSRAYTGGGTLRRLDLSSLALSDTELPALQILSPTTAVDNIYCEGLSSNGVALTDARCGGARPTVTGSAMTCTR